VNAWDVYCQVAGCLLIGYAVLLAARLDRRLRGGERKPVVRLPAARQDLDDEWRDSIDGERRRGRG
jgi:hypothetical protein